MSRSFYEAPRSRVYIDDYEVDLRLSQLGLTRLPLILAVRRGDIARRNTGRLELPSAPGFNAVSKGVEALREETISLLWHPDRFLGIEVAMNNERTVAVTVTEGDVFCGTMGDRDPRTKALKGPNTSRAVEDNRLFDDPEVTLWLLLTLSTDEGLFAELSRPFEERDGVVYGWNERILLGDVSEGGALAEINRSPQTAPSEQAIVNVIRKQA